MQQLLSKNYRIPHTTTHTNMYPLVPFQNVDEMACASSSCRLRKNALILNRRHHPYQTHQANKTQQRCDSRDELVQLENRSESPAESFTLLAPFNPLWRQNSHESSPKRNNSDLDKELSPPDQFALYKQAKAQMRRDKENDLLMQWMGAAGSETRTTSSFVCRRLTFEDEGQEDATPILFTPSIILPNIKRNPSPLNNS